MSKGLERYEFYDLPAIMRVAEDETIHIYYGPNGPLEPRHGHVVANQDGGTFYMRRPSVS